MDQVACFPLTTWLWDLCLANITLLSPGDKPLALKVLSMGWGICLLFEPL